MEVIQKDLYFETIVLDNYDGLCFCQTLFLKISSNKLNIHSWIKCSSINVELLSVRI